MPSGRGSSSASSVLLAEAIRVGTAPARNYSLAEADSIIPVGALVAQKLYGKTRPVPGHCLRGDRGLGQVMNGCESAPMKTRVIMPSCTTSPSVRPAAFTDTPPRRRGIFGGMPALKKFPSFEEGAGAVPGKVRDGRREVRTPSYLQLSAIVVTDVRLIRSAPSCRTRVLP